MQVLVNAEVINKCSSTEPDISLDNLKILFLTRALIRERGRIVYLMNSNQNCVICAPALPVIPRSLLPALTSERRWGSRGAMFKSPASATCWGDAPSTGALWHRWLLLGVHSGRDLQPVPAHPVCGSGCFPACSVAAGLARHSEEWKEGPGTEAVGVGCRSNVLRPCAGDRGQ